MSEQGKIVVLESVRELRPTTNPYIVQLIQSLRDRDDVRVELFTFPKAIIGRYDVFHVHWPEVMFGGSGPIQRFARRALASLVAIRLAVTRTPVVRTWHNTERPSDLSRWDERILDSFDRRTAVVIRVNDVTEPHLDVPVRTVLLGHYREWYSRDSIAQPVAGRVANVGLIRRYKGVEDLVTAFRDVSHEGASLSVAGRPSTSELAGTIRGLAGDDERISLRFEYIDDADFVSEITRSSLVVLPFVHMHNSSTVIAALSLGRPVLVPDNEVNRRLAVEVGEGWIHTYTESISAADIDRALAAGIPASEPDLDARGWDVAARLHAETFALATAARSGGREAVPA